MKKFICFIPILGLLFSCMGEKKQTENIQAELQEQIEGIEESTQRLDDLINSSDDDLEKNQNEIDSLLSNI